MYVTFDIVFDRTANYSTTGLYKYRILREVNVGSFGFNDVTSTMCVLFDLLIIP